MAPRKKADDHDIPVLTDLEAENIIVRKRGKDRKKPVTGSEDEHQDWQPEHKE
jgi:hypothetical protein